MLSRSFLSIFCIFLTIPHPHPIHPLHQGSVSTVDDWKATMNQSRLLARASQPGSSSSRQRSPSPTHDWSSRQGRQSAAGDTRQSTAQAAYPISSHQSARHSPTSSPKKNVSMMDAAVIDVFYPEPELPIEPFYEEFDDEVSVNSTTTRVGNEFRVRPY